MLSETGERNYSIDLQDLNLNFVKFDHEINANKKAILVFTGFGLDYRSKDMQKIAFEASKLTKRNSYLISVHQKDKYPSFEFIQKAAIKFKKEEDLDDVIALGYSQGGSIATKFSKDNTDISKLILLAPMGLEEQRKEDLTKRFIASALFVGPITTLIDSKGDLKTLISLIESGSSIRNNLLKDIKRFGIKNFSRNISNTLIDLTASNLEIINNLKCPVVIVQGKNDIVSRTISNEKVPNAKIILIEKFSHHTFPFHNHEEIVKLAFEK